MSKKYNSAQSLGLGNMTPTMTKAQKDHVERMTDAQIENHFKSHRELPAGRNFTCWNRQHQPSQDAKYKENFDRIFPNAPGFGL